MTGVFQVMVKIFVSFCCAFSLFQVALSSSDVVQPAEDYGSMGYKDAIRLGLCDEKGDGPVKLNVHGKLVTLPTVDSGDSSSEELQNILGLDSKYRGCLNVSSHLKFSALMVALKLPVCYDLVDISKANPHEIARLPLEFFKRQHWNSSIHILNAIKVLSLLAEDKMEIAASNLAKNFMLGISRSHIDLNLYTTKDGIFPNRESFWRLLKDGAIKYSMSSMQYLLIDASYESIIMLDKIFFSKTDESDVGMFTRVGSLFLDGGESMTTFPKLLECSVKRERSSSPFVNLQKCFEPLDFEIDNPSKRLIGRYKTVFLAWIDQSLKNGKSMNYFEYQLRIWDQCKAMLRQGYHRDDFPLIEHLHRFDHDTWRSLFSKFSFLLKLVPEPLQFFLGYSPRINSHRYTMLNRNNQIQDPNEVFQDDDMANVICSTLSYRDIIQIFALNPKLKLSSKLADLLLSSGNGFNPVGLLYYTESDHPMPKIEWMTKFDPELLLKKPETQYEHDLFSRILKNIDKIPKENYPGLIKTFRISLLKLLPESMVLDILKQTEAYPKVQFLPCYIEHFDTLFNDVKEVMRAFFNSRKFRGKDPLFLPLYSRIFGRFGSQVSEFLGKGDSLKMTWIVVEFFSNLPHGTEIKSELMEMIKTHRMDIWLWIKRHFNMVTKGDFCVLAHKSN
jgi:hypothetical protein